MVSVVVGGRHVKRGRLESGGFTVVLLASMEVTESKRNERWGVRSRACVSAASRCERGM